MGFDRRTPGSPIALAYKMDILSVMSRVRNLPHHRLVLYARVQHFFGKMKCAADTGE